MPSEAVQRAALRERRQAAIFRSVVSGDPVYGVLRTQLELLQEADLLAPPPRGPRPKREMLLRILAELEEAGLPIRTSMESRTVTHVAQRIGRSPAQARDLLHQLADMAAKIQLAGIECV